jgi:hypothetical protein
MANTYKSISNVLHLVQLSYLHSINLVASFCWSPLTTVLLVFIEILIIDAAKEFCSNGYTLILGSRNINPVKRLICYQITAELVKILF